jgi:hypothetical protein
VWGGSLANACFDCHTGAETGASKPLVDTIPNPVSQAEYTAQGHGLGTGSKYPGSVNSGAGLLFNNAASPNCYSCHDSAAGHAPAAAAADPYRLGVYATNTTGLCDTCHGPSGTAARVNIQEHTKTMTGSTKTWPSGYDFKCVDCHDPHGDANYSMVRSYLSAPTASNDASFGSNSYGTPQDTGAASAVVFTSTAGMAAGSYGITGAGALGICEVCHTQTVYWRRDIASESHVPGTRCTNCHKHTQGFKPPTCESCHNGNTPYVQGSATAPNVMGDGNSATGTGGATPKPYDNGTYGFNVNGHGRDDTPDVPGNTINVGCTACHDTYQSGGAHIDGVINGRLSPDTRTANSFYLLSAFVKATPASDYDVQVTFDNACATLCHGALQMRHAVDAVPALNAVQFGTHTSYSEPQNTPPPYMFFDRNLKSAATFGGFDGGTNYALCVSCHDPHGTNAASPRADLNNKMMIFKWSNPSTLCAQCHP